MGCGLGYILEGFLCPRCEPYKNTGFCLSYTVFQIHSVCEPDEGKRQGGDAIACLSSCDNRHALTGLLVQPASRPVAGDNDTSVLNASRHWTARHQHGESADLILRLTNGGQAGVMML
jgi:hypothetical protein